VGHCKGADIEIDAEGDLRKTLREDFSRATRCLMLLDRSTTNTTSGFEVSGRLNLGTSVSMRAVELGMEGCISRSALGVDRLTHLMRRMKSLPSSVDVRPRVARACFGLKALSGVPSECPPRYIEIA
jgi:hypothetical protein